MTDAIRILVLADTHLTESTLDRMPPEVWEMAADSSAWAAPRLSSIGSAEISAAGSERATAPATVLLPVPGSPVTTTSIGSSSQQSGRPGGPRRLGPRTL